MKPTNDRDHWSAFSEALARKPEKLPPGKGWISSTDVRKKLGLTASRVSEKMTEAISAGNVERFEGSVVRNGNLTRAVWFRPVKRK